MISNFRDLGGLQNKEGRIIPSGRLYRSANLHWATKDDLTGISAVIDLRTETERQRMPDQIPEEVKEDRLKRLMTLQQSISQENSETFIGETVEVLVESYDALQDVYRGRSAYSAPDGVDGLVFIHSEKKLEKGEFYPVRITEAEVYDLIGEI